jgi:predicted N-acetyltransferase YhbS
MNIIIRPEKETDYQTIKMVNDRAFGQSNEGIMIEHLRARSDYIAELSLVAVIDDTLVGHLLLFPVTIKNDLKTTTTLSLAPMAVHPDFQKKGIGSQLVWEALNKAKKLGFNSVIVVGHPKYYPRFGFKPASTWNIQLPLEVPDEAFMAIELKPDSLKNCSGIVEYPKEYWDTL